MKRFIKSKLMTMVIFEFIPYADQVVACGTDVIKKNKSA
jgi:hypothetical protein